MDTDARTVTAVPTAAYDHMQRTYFTLTHHQTPNASTISNNIRSLIIISNTDLTLHIAYYCSFSSWLKGMQTGPLFS